MLFNTPDFFYFFAIVFAVYWCLYSKPVLQNLVLLFSSFFFYAQLKFELVYYLLAVILIGYAGAIFITRATEKHKKKLVLAASIVLATSFLIILKYSSFIAETAHLLTGNTGEFEPLKILVPVGLSFYTFGTISYLVDVYRKEVDLELNFVTYASYISFFPHLLSGPIPLAAKILPQFRQHRHLNLDDAETGIAQFLWGLFKKMVIADNISLAANYCFANYENQTGSTLFIGVLLFGFQVYADFSGYSDMARGLARLLGIDLIQNFKMPFFSRNPSEFWRKWHLSLINFFTQYIYIPIGGKHLTRAGYIALLMFIFFISGLWHGANWTFVCWGVVNGLLFIPYYLSNQLIRHKTVVAQGRLLPRLSEAGKMILTFNAINLTRVFFKSPNIGAALGYYRAMVVNNLVAMPSMFIAKELKWCALLVIIEWFTRSKEIVLEVKHKNRLLQYLVFVIVAIAIYLFRKQMSAQEYYYFRF